MSKQFPEIDFIITWVDGNDPKWIAERNSFAHNGELSKPDVGGSERYEDNGLLRFLFRGIERFAPWVHRVYFVTWGHLPPWLNPDAPKLKIVNHRDFIPAQFLPTFNSDAIALNLQRIPNLSERFVYFNDDMYLLSPVTPELFFKKGLPRDMAVNEVITADAPTAFWHSVFHDIILLNQDFRKKEVIRKNRLKWFTFRYGRNVIKNLALAPFNMFSAFYEPHLPASYLKSEFEEAWEIHPDLFDASCACKFRDGTGITENYVRYRQMAKGLFIPINKDKYGFYATMKSNGLPALIKSGKYKYVCINDEADERHFSAVSEALESVLPDKSSYEL